MIFICKARLLGTFEPWEKIPGKALFALDPLQAARTFDNLQHDPLASEIRVNFEGSQQGYYFKISNLFED
jgi:hypothetical protein